MCQFLVQCGLDVDETGNFCVRGRTTVRFVRCHLGSMLIGPANTSTWTLGHRCIFPGSSGEMWRQHALFWREVQIQLSKQIFWSVSQAVYTTILGKIRCVIRYACWHWLVNSWQFLRTSPFCTMLLIYVHTLEFLMWGMDWGKHSSCRSFVWERAIMISKSAR